MSRESQKTTEHFLDRMKQEWENSPYSWMKDIEEPRHSKDELLISVIIPARNEWPNIVHTIHSILNCFETDGIDYRDTEIIIVDNGSDDEDPRKPADKGTWTHLLPRGIFWKRILRLVRYPICGNHTARNYGAYLARGKYLFFSDGHMSYKPGFFKLAIETVEKTGGLFHGCLEWMGGYPPRPDSSGKQYTIKLGDEIRGTWSPYLVGDGSHYFYIAAQGHASVFVNRRQFLDFGGYPSVHRTYGGGEFYLDMKWWMFGSSVATHPKAIGWHLKSSRNYAYQHTDYKHNVLNIAYALSMDDWRERAILNWSGVSMYGSERPEVMERIVAEGEKEMAEDRKFIESKRVTTFNDMLLDLPWDRKNMEEFGTKNSSLMIFHYSWIEGAKKHPIVWKKYQESETQKKLSEFIETKLTQYIYKRDQYVK